MNNSDNIVKQKNNIILHSRYPGIHRAVEERKHNTLTTTVCKTGVSLFSAIKTMCIHYIF